jgi:phage tail-like protein
MDVNGLNFWMLNTAADWLPPGGSDTLYFCTKKQRLQLRSSRTGSPPVENFTIASAMVESTPMTEDSFGNYARWDATALNVAAGGSATGEVVIYTPPAGQTVTDLCMGYDGVLYIAVAGTLVLVDRRNRWANFTLSDPTFKFWRLLSLPEGGVLALDRTTPQLGRVAGLPLQVEPADAPDPGILRSCQANGDPTRIVAKYPLPSTETWVAFTAMAGGQYALISWATSATTNTAAFLRLFTESAGLTIPWTLSGTVLPYAIAWLGNQQLAILASTLNEALIFDLQGAATKLTPAGDTYILAGVNSGPFVHTLSLPPYYSLGTSIYPLLPLSLNSLASSGTTVAAKVIDSGSSQTIWHRLFMEAVLPPRCGVLVSLAASNNAADFTSTPVNPVTWYPHTFGQIDPSSVPPETPQGAWVSVPSEVPFAKPLLCADPIQNSQGLFMVLVQRVGTAVRNLTGRYLGLRVQLNGDGRSTPEIAAVRVYASRYSYVDHYLPTLYRENKFGPDADAPGESTRRNFFERFVNIFEAQMTRIEDRIANAYLLMRPESAPDQALEWLGGWIGADPNSYPPGRQRALLLATPDLHQKRGTAAGISQAIDVATNGLATSGAVIVIEAFRLRHIFATILGADLAITNDPLLPGYSGNSNSFVGDTLFLGDPRNPDFLAEFATAVALPQQQAQVQQFLDSLAWRMIVFVHNQVQQVDLNLIGRIVAAEKPAHVVASIQVATQPFLVGMASLVGVNSYLAPEPPLDPVVVDSSIVGRYNVIQHVPSLDPRWENGESNAV